MTRNAPEKTKVICSKITSAFFFLKELYMILVIFGPRNSPFLKCFGYIKIVMLYFRRADITDIFYLFI